MTLAPDDPRHGRLAFLGYRDEQGGRRRCPCDPCRAAALRHHKRRRLLADRGVDLKTSSVGYVRRVHALQAIGWDVAAIAETMGVERTLVSRTIRRSGGITTSTHARIVAAYERLSMTPGPSTRARSRAAAHGWLPPFAWDDETIDDPAATPYRPRLQRAKPNDGPPTATAERLDVDEVVVQRALRGERVPANAAERAEVERRWTRAGGSLNELDELLGWNVRRDRRERAKTDRKAA